MTICGIEHFTSFEFVKQLVPAWIPGSSFWTYFTGAAPIAGGVGLMIEKQWRRQQRSPASRSLPGS